MSIPDISIFSAVPPLNVPSIGVLINTPPSPFIIGSPAATLTGSALVNSSIDFSAPDSAGPAGGVEAEAASPSSFLGTRP